MSSEKANFVLTKDNVHLTFDQRRYYELNGFIIFRRFVPLHLLNKCSQRFDDIAAGIVDGGAITIMRDVADRNAVNKIQDIHHDEVLMEYISYKPILDIVEAFTGPNIMAVNNMLIAKPPDSGSNSSRHPPHQDLYYFPFRPVDRIVASWTAIEPCNALNGCLYVCPGSQNDRKLYHHCYPPGINNKFYHGIQDFPSNKWLNLEMEPGDTVFFHPLLVHGSAVNKSKRTRKAISCHYAAADCHYIDVQGTIQDSIAKEVVEVATKKLGTKDLEFIDIWRMRSTLVRGIRSSL